ncbi:DUF4199 domain-containing protein [Hyphobacterium sp.]|uniref:DUF4199 domain-containing protein n=1 Tax=Hyphobacterium sp. TaxID=2004662 RepID=UPI003B52CDD0
MLRYVLIFGSIAGIIVGTLLVAGAILFAGETGVIAHLSGYLSMLIALSFVFVAVKRYRDVEKGGVIKFWPALGLGLLVSALASVFYVAAWEAYLAVTGYEWLANYMAVEVAAMETAGIGESEIAVFREQMQEMTDLYRNWWFRLPVTMSEILPVGLLISLVSAALLRNPKFLPQERIV